MKTLLATLCLIIASTSTAEAREDALTIHVIVTDKTKNEENSHAQ